MDWPSMSPDLNLLNICGASSNERWRSARSLTSTSSLMSSWRSGRGLQWQPVKLWWTLDVHQTCYPLGHGCNSAIIVARQNIDTLGPNLDIFTFVASALDINGCMLSYFEGTSNLHYIQAVHSLLHIVAKCNFFCIVTWKDIRNIYKNVRGVLTSMRYCT